MCKSELSTNPPIGANPIVAKHVLLGKKTEIRHSRISVFLYNENHAIVAWFNRG